MPFPKKLLVSMKSKHEVPSILLVGDLGLDLERFATEIVQEADIANEVIEVHTTNMLPLSGTGFNDSLSVSLVIFLIDVRNKESAISARKSIKFLPIEYFMGRLLLIGLNVADESRWCIGPEEISDFAKECDCDLLWGELSYASTQSILPSQILRKLRLLSSHIPYHSSLTISG